jgi:FkbM family methyltransferase
MIINNRYNRTYKVSDEDIYWQKMLSKGIFQIENIRTLRNYKPNAKTIIDVGANIGTNTIEYATWADRVISFEPSPELYSYLLFNIQNNVNNVDTYRWHDDISMNRKSNITTYNVALGNKQDIVKLKEFANNKGKNYITNDGIGIDVSVQTLDSYNFIDVDIIKIDVEGYELFVLEGAEQTIMKYKPVIQTELHQGLFKRQNLTIQDIADWFYRHNYKPYNRKGELMPTILPTDHSGMDLFWIYK